MNFAEFIEEFEKKYSILKDIKLRRGQVFYNYLFEIKPTMAKEINGTNLDPYYKDQVSSETYQFVSDNWNNF